MFEILSFLLNFLEVSWLMTGKFYETCEQLSKNQTGLGYEWFPNTQFHFHNGFIEASDGP